VSYPDFIDDREGLERWRESSRTGNGHKLVANNNTVFRFVQTIDRLTNRSDEPSAAAHETAHHSSPTPDQVIAELCEALHYLAEFVVDITDQSQAKDVPYAIARETLNKYKARGAAG